MKFMIDINLIEREKMLSNENKKLKNLLDSHKISYNNTHKVINIDSLIISLLVPF